MAGILEVCADSMESALAAERGGADRIELCGNLVIGGTTPSQALFEKIRKETSLKIRVLLRPRFGDFCYSQNEYEILKEEVKLFRRLGADGIVIGCLNPDGSLNMEQMQGLIAEAGDMDVALHRAFDVSRDALEALEQAISLGCRTILTSGQKNSAWEGREFLAKLQQESRGRIEILAGSGIKPEIIDQLHEETGIASYHMSGKVVVESKMTFRREGVNMGLPGFSEYEIWQSSVEKIKEARKIVDQLPFRVDRKNICLYGRAFEFLAKGRKYFCL